MFTTYYIHYKDVFLGPVQDDIVFTKIKQNMSGSTCNLTTLYFILSNTNECKIILQ